MKIRIAVVTTPDGDWAAYGYRDSGDESAQSILGAIVGGLANPTYHWLEVEVPQEKLSDDPVEKSGQSDCPAIELPS